MIDSPVRLDTVGGVAALNEASKVLAVSAVFDVGADVYLRTEAQIPKRDAAPVPHPEFEYRPRTKVSVPPEAGVLVDKTLELVKPETLVAQLPVRRINLFQSEYEIVEQEAIRLPIESLEKIRLHAPAARL